MKKLYTLSILFILLFSGQCIAQISGINTDKLAAINATTLQEALLEFEPTYSYSRSLGFFDQEGSYKDYAGIIIGSALSFRATYGVNENWEIGANVSTQVNSLSLGTKYHLLGNDKFGLGVFAGINSDITNGPRTLSSLERQYVLGLASHYHFSELLSINTSFQYQDSRDYLGSDLFINSEFGYYINDVVMLIAGFGLSKYSNSGLASSSLFSFYPGFNYEKKKFNIALQSQFDLTGKNINSNNGISISITQILN